MSGLPAGPPPPEEKLRELTTGLLSLSCTLSLRSEYAQVLRMLGACVAGETRVYRGGTACAARSFWGACRGHWSPRQSLRAALRACLLLC